MSEIGIAVAAALFLWWFSTGAILWVVRRADDDGPDGHIWSALLSTPVLFAGVVGLQTSLEIETSEGAYIGFVSALAIWGWIELAFLSGVITGPNRSDCPPEVGEAERFRRAWGTVAYHEALLAVAMLAVGLLSWDAPNQTAFWCFGVLFAARISAKLNLYLGVPRIQTAFLPRTLMHLPSHMRIARQTWLFPISVTGLSLAVGCWIERLYATGETAFALLATLTALALIEHWLMVLPLPDEKLWRWMMPAPKNNDKRLLSEDTP